MISKAMGGWNLREKLQKNNEIHISLNGKESALKDKLTGNVRKSSRFPC